MKYLFILGRNVELSFREVMSYFKKEGISVLNYSLNKNGLLVGLDKEIGDIVNFFGGVISIGKFITKVDSDNFELELDSKELYLGTKNNINYVLWNFSDDEFYGEISDYLKKRFRSEKLKATEKKINDLIKLQNGDVVKNCASSKLLDDEFFVFGEDEKYFGRITQKCDYDKLEKRDMEKPIRREKFSISPRLAKIMINLSEVKKEQTLIDSFCGIGVILQEALLQGINVIGIDKDRNAIKNSKKNLSWFGFSKDKYNLISGDSRKISVGKANVLVAEPYFGEALRKIPTEEMARKMISNFENLMISMLNNLKKNISGRIVFTAPLIKINKKDRVSCDVKKICEKTGLRLVEGFPLPEFRDDQIVGRKIVVLEH